MKNESLHISLSDAEGKFFKQKHSIIRVLGGCFFSAADKNLDSEAQATANRKKVYFHALPNTRQNCQYIRLTRTTTLSIYHLYLELCVAVTFQSRICFCSLISKRDFKAIKFYWCKHLCIQCILLEYLQMFSLFMNHLVSRNLFEQAFLENEKKSYKYDCSSIPLHMQYSKSSSFKGVLRMNPFICIVLQRCKLLSKC